MNPFTALNDTAKLVLTGLAILAVVAGLLFVRSLFGDRAELKAVRTTDKRIATGAKAADAAAKQRDNAAQAFFTANQTQAAALVKELDKDEADFDDSARADYFRVYNDALRGPQR